MASFLQPKGTDGPPLIMVSNRLPLDIGRTKSTFEKNQCAGGLWATLAPLVWKRLGVWVGWSGKFSGKYNIASRVNDDNLLSHQFVAVNLPEREFEEYNSRCCYSMLWPLFHSFPTRAEYEPATWEAYCRVNAEFARCTLLALRGVIRKLDEEGRTDEVPLVWIHDYKLFSAATTIRQVAQNENIRCKLGFFLYVPFPSWNILSLCPWADKILQGILAVKTADLARKANWRDTIIDELEFAMRKAGKGTLLRVRSCDVIGFHNDDYCLNFLDSCSNFGWQVDHLNMTIQLAERSVQVEALPVGIHYNQFNELAVSVPALINVTDNVKVVLAIDRLDYTKGIALRIRAFEKLLEKHPEHIGKVTLLQVAVPSRTKLNEYKAIKEEVEQLVIKVNDRFSRVNWIPIKYIYGYLPQEQIISLYRDAAVAMVTPLRDGVSLVAKEFVACQIREPGVLVLSQFAGSETAMSEAIVVNPYDIDKTIHALQRALNMPLEEKKQRMMMLRQRESSQNIFIWTNSFLSTLEIFPYDLKEKKMQVPVPPSLENFDSYLTNCIYDCCKLVLILEYDTLLTDLNCNPPREMLSEEVRGVLKRLASMQGVDIAIVSSCSLKRIHDMVNIEGITYAGEYGFEILHTDGTKFIHPVPKEQAINFRDLTRELQVQVCRKGAWLETKGAMLTFHYRDAPGRIQGCIVSRASEIFNHVGYEYRLTEGVMEARPPLKWDMGKACIYILRTMHGIEWSKRVRAVYAGVEGEDAMQTLRRIAFTFRVDPAKSDLIDPTAEVASLTGRDAVFAMLKWVEHKMSKRITQRTTSFCWPSRFSGQQILNQQLLEPTHFQVSIEEEEELF